MRIAALATQTAWERRTPVTPASTERLIREGHELIVEPRVGAGAGFSDDQFEAAGARVGPVEGADLAVTVGRPHPDRIGGVEAVLGFLEPLDAARDLAVLASSGATLFAFELVPRTTRAQVVDALSSQATIAGYEATLEAARHCHRIFPMLTTAAGTIRPATVLVLGAGVAGLQAIATARRLGAVTLAFDVREAAAEQVESLGARFISLDIEAQDQSTAGGYARELATDSERRLLEGLFGHVTGADAVVTAAAIPGRNAPRLVTAEMVAAMDPGAVVVDTAAATGGNCDLTRAGEVTHHHGVTVSGPLDLPSRAALHASELYARNVAAFVRLVVGDDATAHFDVEDDIVAATMAARGGELVHERVVESMQRSA